MAVSVCRQRKLVVYSRSSGPPYSSSDPLSSINRTERPCRLEVGYVGDLGLVSVDGILRLCCLLPVDRARERMNENDSWKGVGVTAEWIDVTAPDIPSSHYAWCVLDVS